jgi:hypothetical protein
MAQQRGTSVRLIYDTEATFKTTPASGTSIILPYVKESLRMNRNLITSNTIRSSRNPQMPVRGNRDVSGSIEFELAPQYGLLLKHVFGTTVTTGSYVHTYKVGDLPQGMVIEKRFPDLAVPYWFKYNGCKVNSFKVAVKPEGMITGSVDIIGAKETLSSGTSFDPNPTDRGHTPFDGFECTLLEGGTSLGIGTEVNFSLDNGLDGNNYVIDGTGERYSMPEGFCKVTGNVKCLFDSVAMYNKAVAHTESSLVVTFAKGTGAGTAGNEKLIFYFDELVFKPSAPAVEGPTGLFVSLDFEAYYGDDADVSACRAVLMDSLATY